MKDLVSIIIPFTDSDNYADYIEMLNDQSHENKEIICIVKNKSDLESHPNTLILEKEYEDLETAWNYGLNESNGEYVLFLTADSIIEDKDLLKNTIKELESHDLDFIFYQTTIENEKNNEEEFIDENKIKLNNDFKLLSINNVLNNSIFNHEDILEVIFEMPSIPMNKIYRKEFLEKNNISFKNSIFSSYLFYYDSILKADRIAYLKDESIKMKKHDSFNPNDINDISNLKNKNVSFNEYLETIIEIKKIFGDLSVFNEYKKSFYKKFIPHIFYQFYLIDEEEREEDFKIIKEYLPKIIGEEEYLLKKKKKNVLKDFKTNEYYGNTINEDLKTLFKSDEIEAFTIRHDKNLEKLCLMAGVDYKSAHAFRYGHINFGMSHAKNMQEFKAVSLNVMHGSMDITDKIYSRMNIDTVNETITNLGFESTPLPVQKNSNDIPISELLASLPLEIREKIVREKLGLA